MQLRQKFIAFLGFLSAVSIVTAVFGLGASNVQASSLNDYIVKLKTSDSSSLTAIGSNIREKFGFNANPNFQNIYTFNSSLSLSELEKFLGQKAQYLEVNTLLGSNQLTATSLVLVNDPGFTANPADIDRSWGLPKANFLEAWNSGFGSSSVVVAVIDTGVDESHEDLLAAHFVPGYNFLKDEDIGADGKNYDDNGHGTLVSGIIAAVPNNSLGIAGAASKSSIMPLKALDSDGSGNAADIAEAIVWGTDHGANIINISLGGVGFAHNTVLADSISYAYSKNVVIVAAAGNDVATTGGNLDKEPVFPICNDNGENMVIGVASTDQNDQKADFSNFGKNCIDVTAPGKRIISTINHDPITKQPSPNLYAYGSGTSLSVPFVSSLAALLRAKFPNATNKQIRDRILSSSDNIDSLNLSQCGGFSCKGLIGFGRINAAVSLSTEIVSPQLSDGTLVEVDDSGVFYYINGGKKQLVSDFIRDQRFSTTPIVKVSEQDLARFPDGSYAEPLDGTLIKSESSPTVYYMSKGLKLPVTAQIFTLRNFSFSQVVSRPQNEVSSWLTASFLTPAEGSLLRTVKNPTVYWVVSGSLHPINYNFYIDRGLNIFPVIFVSDSDIKSFSKGEAYIR